MPKAPIRPLRDDPRTSAEIARSLLAEPEPEVDDTNLMQLCILHERATETELDLGIALCNGAAPRERMLGTDILGQLGGSERAFLEDTVEKLISLLNDPVASVAGAAGVALGHRNSIRAIAPARALAKHQDAEARFGAVCALSNHDDPSAIDALIALSADADHDVRNWATFGLAQLTSWESPQLRDALLARTNDASAEIRGEALIGLARRRDERVVALLEKELAGDFLGAWPIEAAHLIKAPSLHPLLIALKTRFSEDETQAFGRELDAAILACRIENGEHR